MGGSSLEIWEKVPPRKPKKTKPPTHRHQLARWRILFPEWETNSSVLSGNGCGTYPCGSPEPIRAYPSRFDPVRTDSSRYETIRAYPILSEPIRADPSRFK